MDQKKVITLEDRIPKLKTQRKQRTNRRLIYYLSFFFLLLLAVIYFQSPLSDIKQIDVVGNRNVSEQTIIQMSGLNERTSYWGVNKLAIVEMLSTLVEIEQVKIERKFPNTLVIHVKEYSRVAYLISDSKYLPILETGLILDKEEETNRFPTDAPLLMNWKQNTQLAEMAAELSIIPESLIQRISEIYFTPTQEDPLNITLLMNDGFKVNSTIRHFSQKIQAYPVIAKELDPSMKGIIHMKMNPYFEPIFDNEEEEEIESER